MVLDNTGSMADNGKMPAMQKAAKDMIDQLSAFNKTTGDVYISIVPFTKDVNVGKSNVAASWINWTEWEAEPPVLTLNSYPINVRFNNITIHGRTSAPARPVRSIPPPSMGLPNRAKTARTAPCRRGLWLLVHGSARHGQRRYRCKHSFCKHSFNGQILDSEERRLFGHDLPGHRQRRESPRKKPASTIMAATPAWPMRPSSTRIERFLHRKAQLYVHRQPQQQDMHSNHL